MADHVRKRIRAAAASALTGLTTTGARVYASRAYPMQDANLPGLRIGNPAEDVSVITMNANPVLERVLELNVDACVKAVSGYEDMVDEIVKEVEVALAANQTLGSLCKFVRLRRIATEISGDGEKPVAVATMTFDVSYYTNQNAPDVAV